LKVLRSTPLSPLATRMRALMENCVQFDGATAFVSNDAVQDLIVHALDAGAKVRFLTGTFGATTRKKTFDTLLRLGKKHAIFTRIWNCSLHQNFHAKLYLWRLRNGRGVAWIGSSNFTNGGLQSEGELVVEVAGRWDGASLWRLRAGFEHEWKRGKPLSAAFVGSYEESERNPPDFTAPKRRRHSGSTSSGGKTPKGRFFVTAVHTHLAEGSPTYERVESLLNGTANHWLRHFSKRLGRLRAGQRGFIVDTIDRDVALVEVTDRVRDGRASVFAYMPVLSRSAWKPWNAATRRSVAAELGFRGRQPRTRWISSEMARRLTRLLYPRRRVSW